MIRDAINYSTAQAITATGNTDSTNTIDQLAAGDAYNPAELRISVNTTFTSGDAATLAVNLVTDDAAGFGTATTIPLVAATAVATLTAGTVLYSGRYPRGLKRYHKLQYVVGVAVMTAGKIDAHPITETPTNK